MKPQSLVQTFLFTTSVAFTPCLAAEVDFTKIPAPVQKTIQDAQTEGTLDDVKTRVSKGNLLYVADFEVPGENNDVELQISPEGKLIATQREIAFTEAPESVQKTAQDRLVNGSKIDEVVKRTADGAVTFLIEINQQTGPDLHLILTSDGSVLEGRPDNGR